MKTEEQIKLRINALKIDLVQDEKYHNLEPFEAGRLNYTIQALEWVLKDIPNHCSNTNKDCLDSHNCTTCVHNNVSADDEACTTCISSYCQYLNKKEIRLGSYVDGLLHKEISL